MSMWMQVVWVENGLSSYRQNNLFVVLGCGTRWWMAIAGGPGPGLVLSRKKDRWPSSDSQDTGRDYGKAVSKAS
jgi:hypothetical protein